MNEQNRIKRIRKKERRKKFETYIGPMEVRYKFSKMISYQLAKHPELNEMK